MSSKSVLLALLLLMLISEASAMPPGHGLCPPGAPSPDGTTIVPQAAGVNSCVLTDFQNATWQFQGTSLFRSGINQGAFFPVLQINSSGRAWTHVGCTQTVLDPWLYYSSVFARTLWWPNGSRPGHAIDLFPARNVTQGINSADLLSLADGMHDGDTIQINALSEGVPVWYMGTFYIKNNVTFHLMAGARMGCGIGFVSTANYVSLIVPDDTGGVRSGSTTIGEGSTTAEQGGSEIAFNHDGNDGTGSCRDVSHDPNWLITRLYLHDCDFGITSKMPSSGSGTITDVWLDHNGIPSVGGVTGGNHNIYLSKDIGFGALPSTAVATLTNVRSYCTHNSGFQFKTRWHFGVITNSIFAHPSQAGYTDCRETVAVDMSCSGNYTFGDVGAGTGVIFELGPGSANDASNGDGVIRYGRENQISGACGEFGGWSNSVLLIQNCWIINDDVTHTGIKAIATDSNNFINGATMTIKNCKLVNIPGGLGTNVIDGGGNTIFADRAAAGLAAYPALPAVP